MFTVVNVRIFGLPEKATAPPLISYAYVFQCNLSLWLQLVGKTRTREKYRTVYNERQKIQLEEQYLANTYISAEQKAKIARDVGLTERQVKIWFQNRRAKDRRQKYQSCDEDLSAPQQQQHDQQQLQQQFGCVHL